MLRSQLNVIEPLVIIALLVGMILVTVAPVSACSCVLMTPVEEFAAVDAVFAGEVTAIKKDNAKKLYNISVTVLHTWKGEEQIDGEEIVITTPLDSAACGYEFKADENYLIYARLNAKELTVTSCGNTAPLLDALNQFAIIGTDQAAAMAQPESPLAAPTSPLPTPAASPTATPKPKP